MKNEIYIIKRFYKTCFKTAKTAQKNSIYKVKMLFGKRKIHVTNLKISIKKKLLFKYKKIKIQWVLFQPPSSEPSLTFWYMHGGSVSI